MSEVENPAEEIEFTKEGDFKKLIGDANGDRVVNVTDAMLCVDYVLHKDIKMFIFKNADTNVDNKIDVLDIMWIVNSILNRQ